MDLFWIISLVCKVNDAQDNVISCTNSLLWDIPVVVRPLGSQPIDQRVIWQEAHEFKTDYRSLGLMVCSLKFPSIDHIKYIDLTLFNQIAPLLNSSEGSFVVHKQVVVTSLILTKILHRREKITTNSQLWHHSSRWCWFQYLNSLVLKLGRKDNHCRMYLVLYRIYSKYWRFYCSIVLILTSTS